MLSRRHLLSVPLLLLPAGLDLRAQGLPIKTYATVDGLAHNRINRIVKDSRGFLWFCTAGGLSRFDGAMGISINTVSFHLKHIYEKLQVHSKTEAVARALREHLI